MQFDYFKISQRSEALFVPNRLKCDSGFCNIYIAKIDHQRVDFISLKSMRSEAQSGKLAKGLWGPVFEPPRLRIQFRR